MPGLASFQGGASRNPSGRAADSTRITSAPLSARYLVVTGPTPYQVKSSAWIPSNAYRLIVVALRMLDRADRAQFDQLLFAQAEQSAINFAIVLADLRRRPGRSNRCLAELREGPRYGEPSAQRLRFNFDEIAAVLQLRIAGNVRHRRNRRRENPPLEDIFPDFTLGLGHEKALDHFLRIIEFAQVLRFRIHEC